MNAGSNCAPLIVGKANTHSKANMGSRTLQLGFSVGHSSQKGSQGTANLLVGPYHLPQGFICVYVDFGLLLLPTRHIWDKWLLSLGMAIGTGRGQTDHVWSDQLRHPDLGWVQALLLPVSRLRQSTANNGQGHPCQGLPIPGPASARLTPQGRGIKGWPLGWEGPCTAHLCLPSSLPAVPSLLWSEGGTQLSSRHVL